MSKTTQRNGNWHSTQEFRWEPVQKANNHVQMRLQQKYVDFNSGIEEWHNVFPTPTIDTYAESY